MEKQRAKAAERARRKQDREANPTGFIIEAFNPEDAGVEPLPEKDEEAEVE